MSKQQRELVKLTFAGPRFADHALDVDVLPELVTYKKLLIETAKEIWRQRNPSRQRLPKGFEKTLVLKFYRLEDGSTVVPLIRQLELPSIPTFFGLEADEIDEAAEAIDATIIAASNGEPPPDSIPRSVIPMFRDWGKTLSDEDSIAIKSPTSKITARYDKRVKEQILQWAERTYTDEVDVKGEARGTDLDGNTFSLRLPTGDKVQGKYGAEDEQIILDALRQHESIKLRVVGLGEFSHSDGALKRFARIDRIVVAESSEDSDQSALSVLDFVSKLTASVPADEWKNVPSDLSRNVDKRLYGKPKAN